MQKKRRILSLILSFVLGMGCMAFVSCGKDGGEVNENGGSEKGASQSASASVEEGNLPVEEENKTPEEEDLYEDHYTTPCEWDSFYFQSFTDFQDFYGVFKKTHPGKLVSINFDGVECESRRYRYVGDAMYQPTDELGFREFTFAFEMEGELHEIGPNEPGVTGTSLLSDGAYITGESIYVFPEDDFSLEQIEMKLEKSGHNEKLEEGVVQYDYVFTCSGMTVMKLTVISFEYLLDNPQESLNQLLNKIKTNLILL